MGEGEGKGGEEVFRLAFDGGQPKLGQLGASSSGCIISSTGGEDGGEQTKQLNQQRNVRSSREQRKDDTDGGFKAKDEVT